MAKPKVTIERVKPPMLLRARDIKGNEVLMDTVEKFGGAWAGFRPMHLLLASLGGCAVMDVIAILQKMRQEIADIKADVEATPIPNSKPTLFESAHVHFRIYGTNLDEEKVKKAIELTMEKYCSVVLTVRCSMQVTYDWEILPPDTAAE